MIEGQAYMIHIGTHTYIQTKVCSCKNAASTMLCNNFFLFHIILSFS